MADTTEQKAMALLNEVMKDFLHKPIPAFYRQHNAYSEALCRAIEQHEAYRQEVSDAVAAALDCGDVERLRREGILSRFIIAKPDPLVEVLADMGLKPKGGYDWASEFRNTLAQRGGKIVWRER